MVQEEVAAFLRGRLLPAGIDVSASAKGKLQTPTGVECAGGMSVQEA